MSVLTSIAMALLSYELVLYDSHCNGVKYTFSITRLTYHTMPSWEVGKGNPPLLMNQVVKLASQELSVLLGKNVANKWETKSINLVHYYSNKWYWTVVYQLPHKHMDKISNFTTNFTIIILMNGHVIQPYMSSSNVK